MVQICFDWGLTGLKSVLNDFRCMLSHMFLDQFSLSLNGLLS